MRILLIAVAAFTAFIFSIRSLDASARASSKPYISGDTFRAHADHVFDETGVFDPGQIQYGDVVFVKTDYLDTFFLHVHPNIDEPYVLLTHNADLPITSSYKDHYEDPKILHWFAQNLEVVDHPKIEPIPIGLANRHWKHGDIKKVKRAQLGRNKSTRDYFLYVNFDVNTCPEERKPLFERFQDASYAVVKKGGDFYPYLKDLGRSKFVLSPRGNGPERTGKV